VFPAMYERHFHVKNKGITVTDRGGPYVFPVRYEHRLQIKKLKLHM
jgi:hypothetical protein